MFKKISLIPVLAFALAVPMFGSTCPNCTIYDGTASSGSDTTDLGSMESANPSITFTNITFTGATVTSNMSVDDGVTFTGVDGSGPDLHLFNSFGSWTQTPVIGVNNGNGSITAALPTNVYGIGFDFVSLSGGVTTFDVTINNGTVYDLGGGAGADQLPGSGFFGVVSTTPITSVVISGFTGNTWAIDNFEVGTGAAQQSQTPEVATMIIIGLGLLFIRGLRRWMPGTLA